MKNLLALIFISTIVLSCGKEDLVNTAQNQLVDITSVEQFNMEVKEGVSMVFYHASWCSKCAEQRPAVEMISEKGEYNVVFFAEVEYEEHTDLVKAQKINGFPTIVIYKDGVENKRFAGKGHEQSTLEVALKAALN
mgnify:CR=1 FL=1